MKRGIWLFVLIALFLTNASTAQKVVTLKPVYHTKESGESLSKIAENYLMDVPTIRNINHASGIRIRTGADILVGYTVVPGTKPYDTTNQYFTVDTSLENMAITVQSLLVNNKNRPQTPVKQETSYDELVAYAEAAQQEYEDNQPSDNEPIAEEPLDTEEATQETDDASEDTEDDTETASEDSSDGGFLSTIKGNLMYAIGGLLVLIIIIIVSLSVNKKSKQKQEAASETTVADNQDDTTSQQP